MAQYVPHYQDWRTVEKWRTASTVIFYTSSTLSLLEAVKDLYIFLKDFDWLIKFLTITTLIAYSIVELVINYWLAPAAEDKRRADFLDNALGTHFIPANSIDYYTNDDIDPGFYKAAVNLFENSFFTYRVSEAMTVKKTVWTLVIILVVLWLAFNGFRQQPLTLPILQLLFSSVALLDLVNFWYMRIRLEKIYYGWYTLFHDLPQHLNSTIFMASVLRYWLLQETTLARTQVGLDSSIFNKLNPRLSDEWNQIKLILHINPTE